MKLPLDCTAHYHPGFLSPAEADELFDVLLDEYALDQCRLVVRAGGRTIETDSIKALFATPELEASGSHPEHIHGKCHLWSGAMAELRARVEAHVGQPYELAMAIYYPDGRHHAPFHFDQQTRGAQTVLPSISLGAERRFCFRHNDSGEEFSLPLEHGSLLVMGEHCQSRYQHSLPVDGACHEPRINITFREPSFQ